ncbi:MAG: glycosyltransferase family 2 protein [Methylococcales bacterium]|nr:glycosyltransferase family 2 protein [Methylococcales bacterium]
MTFSIIIPTLNEASNIERCLLALQPLRDCGEVIVVDGGSVDNTVELATPYADKILLSGRGRARQMNQGAQQATGDILLFLHADTALPEQALSLIAHAITPQKPWGRFDIRLCGDFLVPTRSVGTHADRAVCATRRVATAFPRGAWEREFSLNMIAFMMNWRSRFTGICTGDQVLFVTQSAFIAVGGYPEIALMEDIAFSRALKKLSRPVCLTAKVTSSARRWQQHGIYKTILLMWSLRLRYWLGAEPDLLAELYRTGSLWKR